MNAAALIVLILALIGIGMIIYYAMICLQMRRPPRRRKPSNNSDTGPLLNYEEDFNGNHEEPVRTRDVRTADHPEASAPKPEEDDNPVSKDGNLELPMKSVSFEKTPECASIKPSSKKGSIALDIDEEPPVLDNSKSLLQPSHERAVGPQATTENLQKSHDEVLRDTAFEKELPYNAMTDCYEEDGLLVPESQNKNLQREQRKRLHAQRSAPPEGYIPHQQLLVQKNTQPLQKHVQFANPQPSVPVIVTDSHEYSTHQTVRPKLKSPHSDPGITKDNIFVFGITHEREVYDEKPVKKVKITDNEDNHDRSINIQSPAVGWVVNLPYKSPDDSNSKNVVLYIEDGENERSTMIPLATSEIDCVSLRKSQKNESGTVSEDRVKPKMESEQMTHASDSDGANSDDVSNIPSNKGRLRVESQDGSGSDSSEPDLTEYSFERGPHTPDPAVSTMLQNEVSCYPDNKIGLTNYIHIPETTFVTTNRFKEPKLIEHSPPTPTSDTKSISPLSSNDNSLDEITAPSPSFIPTNVLGTPPQTPPVDKTSSYISENPSNTVTNESAPSFIVIDAPSVQRRSSSDSLSSSLSSSSSSSNGSYKLDAANNDVQEVETRKSNAPKGCFMKE